MRQFKATITVAELRDLLEGQDDEALVTFASDYGDHCHTQQIHRLVGLADMKPICEDAYSDSGFALAPESDETDVDDEDKLQQVLIIS